MTTNNTAPVAVSNLAKGTRLDVFSIREARKEGGKAFWIRVGSAWVNQDGSINVTLDALPVDGKLSIRAPRPDSDE